MLPQSWAYGNGRRHRADREHRCWPAYGTKQNAAGLREAHSARNAPWRGSNLLSGSGEAHSFTQDTAAGSPAAAGKGVAFLKCVRKVTTRPRTVRKRLFFAANPPQGRSGREQWEAARPPKTNSRRLAARWDDSRRRWIVLPGRERSVVLSDLALAVSHREIRRRADARRGR